MKTWVVIDYIMTNDYESVVKEHTFSSYDEAYALFTMLGKLRNSQMNLKLIKDYQPEIRRLAIC